MARGNSNLIGECFASLKKFNTSIPPRGATQEKWVNLKLGIWRVNIEQIRSEFTLDLANSWVGNYGNFLVAFLK